MWIEAETGVDVVVVTVGKGHMDMAWTNAAFGATAVMEKYQYEGGGSERDVEGMVSKMTRHEGLQLRGRQVLYVSYSRRCWKGYIVVGGKMGRAEVPAPVLGWCGCVPGG